MSEWMMTDGRTALDLLNRTVGAETRRGATADVNVIGTLFTGSHAGLLGASVGEGEEGIDFCFQGVSLGHVGSCEAESDGNQQWLVCLG